jgi:hypothetical protein
MHKQPGLNEMKLGQVPLNLSLDGEFTKSRRRIAYERMLLDVLRDNSALFVRRDEVERRGSGSTASSRGGAPRARRWSPTARAAGARQAP